jgi:hypothetical protein
MNGWEDDVVWYDELTRYRALSSWVEYCAMFAEDTTNQGVCFSTSMGGRNRGFGSTMALRCSIPLELIECMAIHEQLRGRSYISWYSAAVNHV